MCAISSILQYRSAAPVAREPVELHKVPCPIVFVGELPRAIPGKSQSPRRRDAFPHTPRP